MLAVSIPNSATFAVLVDTATKCLATASSPSASTSHARADLALVSVSIVVNVLELMTKSVVAGSRSRTAPQRSAPSTFETNRQAMSGWRKAASAS